MGVKQLESSFARKDLAVLVHNKLHRRKQYGLVTKEAAECQQHRREVTLVSAQCDPGSDSQNQKKGRALLKQSLLSHLLWRQAGGYF